MLSVIITSCSTVLEEDVAAVHAGVLADDRVPRGLDGEDLFSAEEVTRVEEAAHGAQASADMLYRNLILVNKYLGMFRNMSY